MIAREMIAEKVFAESVAKDIRNFLPEKYENAEFQVMQMNKNNGVQMVGVQVRLVSVCITWTVERKISGYNCQIASDRAMTDNRHNDTPVRS